MERLIEAVRQYPCLWNVSNKDYRNMDKKEAVWKCIVDDLNSAEIKNVQDAKSEWKKLRDNHRDSLKRMKSTRTGQAVANLNNWRYAELMEFLLPYMKHRRKSTNLNPNDIQPSAHDAIEAQDDEDSNNAEISVVHMNDTLNDMALTSQGGKTETRKRTADGDLIELLKQMEEIHQKRQEERDLRRTVTNTQEKGAIDLFLESMAITIKAMPAWMQHRVKKKIFLVVSDAEEELDNYVDLHK